MNFPNAYEAMAVGDYVTYVPDKRHLILPHALTGVERKNVVGLSAFGPDGDGQVIFPNLLRKWRVFHRKSGVIELTNVLSTLRVSVKGSTGYENLVKIQKLVADACVNPDFADSARPLGYKATSVECVDYRKVRNDFPYTDKRCFADVQHVKRNHLIFYDEPVFLASRDVMLSDQGLSLCARVLHPNGKVESKELYYSGLDMEVNRIQLTYAVHVLVRLKPNILVLDGAGTKEYPYLIGWGE